MKHFLGYTLAAVAVGLAAWTGGGAPDKAKPKKEAKKEAGMTDPKGVPLELRLAAKKTKYPLDLGGKTAKEFKKQLEEAKKTGNQLPEPPAVDFTLELKNTGDKDIQIQVEGDANPLMLEVKGPGAVSVPSTLAFTADFRLSKGITLAAGKSYQFPALKSLKFGHRGAGQFAYWTEPGEYTVTAVYKTAVSPAPKGAKETENGFGQVTVTSAPVKVKVEGKKRD